MPKKTDSIAVTILLLYLSRNKQAIFGWRLGSHTGLALPIESPRAFCLIWGIDYGLCHEAPSLDARISAKPFYPPTRLEAVGTERLGVGVSHHLILHK